MKKENRAIPSEYYERHEPFFLAKVKKLEVQKRPSGGLEFSIYPELNEGISRQVIDGKHVPNPWLRQLRLGQNPGAEFLKRQIDELAQASPGDVITLATDENPMRWAGSGGILLIADANGGVLTPLNIRPEYAFYGNRLDANGGLSSSVFDWLRPDVLGLREIAEEVIVVANGKIVLPVNLKDDEAVLSGLDIDQLTDRQRKVAGSVLGETGYPVVPVPVEDVTPADVSETISVHFEDRVFVSHGACFVDPATGSLDLRKIYRMTVESIDDLIIVDGETDEDPSRSRNRDILLFNKDDLVGVANGKTEIASRAVFKSGERVETHELIKLDITGTGEGLMMTPVLLRTLEVMARGGKDE